MDPPPKPSTSQSLFQVYLRLRPPLGINAPPQESPTERFILVEPPVSPTQQTSFAEHPASASTHITLQPPTDSRKRAVEKFAFTKIFEEEASQLDLFRETGVVGLVKGVLGGGNGGDGLVATLGVTGSGKSHTILGSKSERGITQMTLDMLFQSLGESVHSSTELASDYDLMTSLTGSDPSEAQLIPAQSFLEGIYGDGLERGRASRAQTPMVSSRAQTPMTVWHPQRTELPINPIPLAQILDATSVGLYPRLLGLSTGVTPPRGKDIIVTPTIRMVHPPASADERSYKSPKKCSIPSSVPTRVESRITRSAAKHSGLSQDTSLQMPNMTRKHPQLPQPSSLPLAPSVGEFALEIDPSAEYAVLVSMYEVYNDRIFDLLSSLSQPTLGNGMTTRQAAMNNKDMRRRPLLFKSTESSPDRKVVAGLRKIICGSYEDAIMVLETGLYERRVAGTGSNSVSSRSHGFFCVEVKRKTRPRRCGDRASWDGKTLTIVDLAGSERARNAKTAGATLAEAGKINESLMYLGQCLQMQSDCQEGSKPNLVPFRQCKLTELLFSNSFAPASSSHHRAQPQKAVMIVTADPLGDFNATSQILRYSALAREVTVPRIPSVTSTIFSGSTHVNKSSSSANFSGRTTPNFAGIEELELAATEIVRLTDECDSLAVRLTEEEIRADEAEFQWRAAEEKAERMEAEIREEVWGEVENKVEEERRRWMGARDEERELNEGLLDMKIELLGKTVKVFEDPEPSAEDRVEALERENEILKNRIAALEREMQGRSPTKSQKTKMFSKLAENTPPVDLTDSGDESSRLSMPTRQFGALALGDGDANSGTIRVTSPKKTPARSPTKKVRKLTTRKWDLGPEEEIL